jgi:chromosome segregation ATPase
MTKQRTTNGHTNGATATMPKRSIHEICEALKIDLAELDEYGQEIEEAQATTDDLAAKRKELAAVEADTARTLAELDKAQRGLTQAQFDTLHNWDQRIFAARAELTELQQALPKAQAELAATEKAHAAADAKHKKLEAHIEKFREDGRRL